MRLYIPALADKIRLTEDWSFSKTTILLEWEFKHFFRDKYITAIDDREATVTIPAGTVLSVSRIYIRATKKDYDSITFHIAKTKESPGIRFWVPLAAANQIEFEPV